VTIKLSLNVIVSVVFQSGPRFSKPHELNADLHDQAKYESC